MPAGLIQIYSLMVHVWELPSLTDQEKSRRSFAAALMAGTSACVALSEYPELRNDINKVRRCFENSPLAEFADMRRLDHIPFAYNNDRYSTIVEGLKVVNAAAGEEHKTPDEMYDEIQKEIQDHGSEGFDTPQHLMAGAHIPRLVGEGKIEFEIVLPNDLPSPLATPLPDGTEPPERLKQKVHDNISRALPRATDVVVGYSQRKYPEKILNRDDKEMVGGLRSDLGYPDSVVRAYVVDTETSSGGEFFPAKAAAYAKTPPTHLERPSYLEALWKRISHENGHALNMKHNTYREGIWSNPRADSRLEMLTEGEVSIKRDGDELRQEIDTKDIDEQKLNEEYIHHATNVLERSGLAEELDLSYVYSYREAPTKQFEDALEMIPENVNRYSIMVELGESDHRVLPYRRDAATIGPALHTA